MITDILSVVYFSGIIDRTTAFRDYPDDYFSVIQGMKQGKHKRSPFVHHSVQPGRSKF